jgi:hypothetical protein
MLNSPTGVFLSKGKIGLKPYRHMICNDMVRHRQYYEDVGKLKDRLQKTVPNIRQVMLKDMARMKTNQVYERILNHDLTGSRGLNLQYK